MKLVGEFTVSRMTSRCCETVALTGRNYHENISLLLLFTLLLCLGLIACTDVAGNDSATGQLKVSITDAPFPISLVKEAIVTINRIEVRSKGGDGETFLTVSDDTFSVDLMTLRNGITKDLQTIDLPVGEYDLIRMYTEDAYLTLTNGTVHEVTIPSGSSTGIKIFIDGSLIIEGGISEELLIDFDLAKSFVAKGNTSSANGITGFNFKPVIKAVNLSTAGSVLGKITNTLNGRLADAQVWLEQDSVITTTFTDSNGEYHLLGIPAGDYYIKAVKDGFMETVDSLTVTAGNQTEKNLELIP